MTFTFAADTGRGHLNDIVSNNFNFQLFNIVFFCKFEKPSILEKYDTNCGCS